MKNLISKYVLNLANVFFVLTLLAFSLPSRYTLERSVGLKPFYPFLIVLITVELFFLFNLRAVEKNRTAKDIAAFVFGFLFLWELAISRFNLIPYIYVPAPENVFYIFISDYRKIIQGFFSSMFLLIIGMATSLTSAVFLGTLVGWIPRLRKAIYPIVKAIFYRSAACIHTVYRADYAIISLGFNSRHLSDCFLECVYGLNK